MTVDRDFHYDFGPLVHASAYELTVTLAETHSAIANLHAKVAFLRAEEDRDPHNRDTKALRHEFEGTRDAYVEKKFLLYQLLKGVHGDRD